MFYYSWKKLKFVRYFHVAANFENKSKAGNIKNPGILEAIKWIARAYRELEKDPISKAFKICNLYIEEGDNDLVLSHCPSLKIYLNNLIIFS